MKKILGQCFIILIFMSILSADSQSQNLSEKVWTEAEAAAWFEKGEWLNNAKFKPHSSINKKEFARHYHKNKAWWDAAFVYLRDTDLMNTPPGKYEIDGENVFVMIAENPKKEFDETKWESHRQYQDIQMVITGAEKMGVAQIPTLKPTQNYDAKTDLIFYNGEGGDIYTAEPGTFFIFFPQDGHRPDIKVEGIEKDKKIVVKVKRGDD